MPVDAGIAVGRVADEREVDRGCSAGSTPNFTRTAAASRIAFGAAIHLHDAIAAHALREILVRRPDADLLDALVGARQDARRRRARRRPRARPSATPRRPSRPARPPADGTARSSARLDAFARLVAGPEGVAERFDDVVGGDADVRGAPLDHLQHGVQHADDRAVRRVLAFVEAAQAVEVTEQLVRAVDEVGYHRA